MYIPGHEYPLVSVIIPCFNHGQYLNEAFASIGSQNYRDIEIIVVDDGSTDDTKEITGQNAEVKYIYQTNKGLSAARNTGIKNSKGEFIIFLDADDWLLQDAINTNLYFLKQYPASAFVSGGYQLVFTKAKTITETAYEVNADHYLQFLKENYIGMHGAVMYQRWVFNEFLFDETLAASEDYDLFLRITRKYPVHHHRKIIAAYRMHDSNMSNNIPLMLTASVKVLKNQRKNLRSREEQKAYYLGIAEWKRYYSKEMYHKLLRSKGLASLSETLFLVKYSPYSIFKYTLKKFFAMVKRAIRKIIPNSAFRLFHKLMYRNILPAPGKVFAGDLNRLTPFSTGFGYDRGGPVDRYYIENFLQQSSGYVKGRVLEIGDNEYTLLYGGDKIKQSDILHVDASNDKATIIGDISNAPQIPDNAFDAIILTQTLHLIYNFKDALDTCHRILKPGGSLLLTVPGITLIDHGEWADTWYWSFTDKSLKKLMPETFPGGEIEVQCFGNVFVATAFLYGMGLPEIEKEKLDFNDPHFQVIITAKATKALAK